MFKVKYCWVPAHDRVCFDFWPILIEICLHHFIFLIINLNLYLDFAFFTIRSSILILFIILCHVFLICTRLRTWYFFLLTQKLKLSSQQTNSSMFAQLVLKLTRKQQFYLSMFKHGIYLYRQTFVYKHMRGCIYEEGSIVCLWKYTFVTVLFRFIINDESINTTMMSLPWCIWSDLWRFLSDIICRL